MKGEISFVKECYNKHLNHSAHLNGKLIDLIGSNLSFFVTIRSRFDWCVLILSIRVTCFYDEKNLNSIFLVYL
jgi:hypothetical protein